MSCVCADHPGSWIALLGYSKQHVHVCIWFIIHTQACKHMFFPPGLCVLPEVSVLAVRGYTRTVWSWAGGESDRGKFTNRNRSFIGNSMMEQKWEKTGF